MSSVAAFCQRPPSSELYFIMGPINYFHQRGRGWRVHHSQSFTKCIMTRISMISSSPISQKCELLQKAQAENIHVKLCWILGCTDVEGNEKIVTTPKNTAEDVSRIMLTRAIDLERPVLAAVKQKKCESGK